MVTESALQAQAAGTSEWHEAAPGSELLESEVPLKGLPPTELLE